MEDGGMRGESDRNRHTRGPVVYRADREVRAVQILYTRSRDALSAGVFLPPSPKTRIRPTRPRRPLTLSRFQHPVELKTFRIVA